MDKWAIVEIFTDGACSGNPGPGGWGAILRFKGAEKELSGGELDTTNNRMELRAAIEGLQALKRPMRVVVYTDSTYVKNGITKWIVNWKQNDWRTAAKRPVRNVDLWLALDDVLGSHEIEWRWVKGHSGHPENERADALARAALQEVKLHTPS